MIEPRVRRNIDSLSAQELDDYVHALTRIHEISDEDPERFDGYIYLEQLHDDLDTGPCEHANDTFLPWHRAHLWMFEEALRGSDPPRTANVTVPYWDFSALPSGKRYPNAFETGPAALLNGERLAGQICRPGVTGPCTRLPYPRGFLDRLLANPRWSTPDAAKSLLTFGGHAGGQSKCDDAFGDGRGSLENEVHDSMHGSYVGGLLASPSEAAQDPIFWSFHCFIDRLWWEWQQQDGFASDTDLDARLCGLFKSHKHVDANRFAVRDTIVPETQLGYTYDEVRVAEAADVNEIGVSEGPFFPTHPAADIVVTASAEPALVRTLDVTIPEPGFAAAHLRLAHVNAALAFSYGADVYLTPAGEELRTLDRDFRDRYLADTRFFWMRHHGGRQHDLTLDLGRVLGALSQEHAGEAWRLSVALAPAQANHAPHGGGDRHGHELDTEHIGLAAAAPPPDDAVMSMDFGELTLEVA